jgi:hypothetical protein
MAPLSFSLAFKTDDLRKIDLPVEIRKPNSTLVTRALSSQTIELKPGKYYGTAFLPGGQRLLQYFEMTEQPMVVTLTPDPDDESQNEWEETSHYLQTSRPSTAPSTERAPLPPGPPVFAAIEMDVPPVRQSMQAWFQLFQGNAVSGPLTDVPLAPYAILDQFEQGRIVQFRVQATSAPLIVQLGQPKSPVRNMALPITASGDALLVFTRANGTCRMEAHLRNNTADLLLRYCAHGAAALGQTAQMLDAQQLVKGSANDHVAAAVAAIALLEYGELSWLQEWTAELEQNCAWMPDAAAIRGEHLARRGKHLEASQHFFEVPLRGLPMFTDALVFTIERLKWYASLKPERAEGIDVQRASAALAQLLPFSESAEHDGPMTTYRGADPAHPLAVSADDIPPPANATNLAQWLETTAQNAASPGV